MTLKTILLGGAALALIGCSAADPDQDSSVSEETAASVNAAPTEDVSTSEKIVVESEADLPRHEFEFTKKPSELVLGDGPEFKLLIDELDDAVTDLLENYDIRDATTKRQMLGLKRGILFSREEWDSYLAIIPQSLELISKPQDRETLAFPYSSYARAAQSASATEGDAFAEAFKAEIVARLSQMDVNIARDDLQSLQGQMQVISESLMEAALKGQIDASIEQAGNVGGRGSVDMLIGVEQTLLLIPHAQMIAEAIAARLAAMISSFSRSYRASSALVR